MNAPAVRRHGAPSVFSFWSGVASLAVALLSPPGSSAQDPSSAIQIFFPPTPPCLGDPIPAAQPAEPAALTAPPALAAYVNEPFYAPLSTRFARSEVGADLDFRLQMYRLSKSALQAELRARLDTLKDTDPATRRQTLIEFSREQTPRIVELEKEADQIRNDLSHRGSGLSEYLRWSDSISKSSSPIERTTGLKVQIIRASAYYGDDLSAAQRRLLVDAMIHLRAQTNSPGSKDDLLLYFSPETARIRLPANPPAELAAQVMAYKKAKRELTTELLQTMYLPKPPAEKSNRLAALQALAVSQAPRFEELENLAENIRLQLAELKDPARQPDLPPLDPGLAARITKYRTDKLALQKALLAKVDEVKAQNPSADSAALGGKIRDAITAFTRRNSAQYAGLDQRRDAIRLELSRLPPGTTNETGAATTDALLNKFSESIQQLETYWNYRDYQAAALQPGLSPEQRRLLFDGAVEKLGLPLPASELQVGSP